MVDVIDAKIKHLEAIQSVVNRLAQNSFTVRGWSVTLVTAVLAAAAVKPGSQQPLIALALIPAWAFWALDAYYLRQERLFRALYRSVGASARREPEEGDVPLFDMSVSVFHQDVPKFGRMLVVPSVALIPSTLTVLVTALGALTL
ncbi:hypothetical protein ACFQFC_35225 [Amorphoplanes digitatis]|uniref:Uncharacterized protein n=1 Tax=Actinoplanes digitatis TaxID=1868 RepID=A0A7W7HV82_9ACTN|nr:hypothetical protein [Actinoplanes digitatis]MBB4761416.1 hypothetical protein [Actinoplanes digitatis]GID94538.1 hypothetical protein Adi01nite_39500 [Actinoplanes digitatis]